MEPAVAAGHETDVKFGDTHCAGCGGGSGYIEIDSRRSEPAFGQDIENLGRRGERRGTVRRYQKVIEHAL